MFVPSSVLDGPEVLPAVARWIRPKASIVARLRARAHVPAGSVRFGGWPLPAHVPSFPCHETRRSSSASPFGTLPLPALLLLGPALSSFESSGSASRVPFLAFRLGSDPTLDTHASMHASCPPLARDASFETPRLAVDTLVSAPRCALDPTLSSHLPGVSMFTFVFMDSCARRLMSRSCVPALCLDSTLAVLRALPSMRTPVDSI